MAVEIESETLLLAGETPNSPKVPVVCMNAIKERESRRARGKEPA